MTDDQLKQLAADFLVSRRIKFLPGGEVFAIASSRSEVVFLVPEALDPDAVVDPPDVRVIVNHESQHCEFVIQM